MDVIKISCSLEWTVPETEKGLVRITRAVLHQIPAGRFRTEPGTEDQRYSWNEGRAELESPCDPASIDHGKVGTSS